MTQITAPEEEYFKDGFWGWDSVAGVWVKLAASNGKLQVETVTEAHAATHENGGDDEVSVTGLSGLLADGQTPLGHKATHAGGGADKIKYTRQILWFLPDATLATGTDKSATIVYRGPALTLVRWDFRAKTAPTGASMIADVNVGGTSIWNTNQGNRPTIAAAAYSGTGTSFDTTSLSDGDVLTLDIDQIGSTIAGGQVTLIIEGETNPETD